MGFLIPSFSYKIIQSENRYRTYRTIKTKSVKKKLHVVFLVSLFFFGVFTQAQMITGVWKGKIGKQ